MKNKQSLAELSKDDWTLPDHLEHGTSDPVVDGGGTALSLEFLREFTILPDDSRLGEGSVESQEDLDGLQDGLQNDYIYSIYTGKGPSKGLNFNDADIEECESFVPVLKPPKKGPAIPEVLAKNCLISETPEMQAQLGMVDFDSMSYALKLTSLGTEIAIFSRFLCKNNMQHRRTLSFRRLLEVHRLLTLLEDIKADQLLTELANLFSMREMYDRQWQVPIGEAGVFVLRRLLAACRLAQLAAAAVQKAAAHTSANMSRMHFVRFHLAILAQLSRMQVLMSIFIVEAMKCYNALSGLVCLLPFQAMGGTLAGEELPHMLRCIWRHALPVLDTIPFQADERICQRAAYQEDIVTPSSGHQAKPLSEDSITARAKAEADRIIKVALGSHSAPSSKHSRSAFGSVPVTPMTPVEWGPMLPHVPTPVTGPPVSRPFLVGLPLPLPLPPPLPHPRQTEVDEGVRVERAPAGTPRKKGKLNGPSPAGGMTMGSHSTTPKKKKGKWSKKQKAAAQQQVARGADTNWPGNWMWVLPESMKQQWQMDSPAGPLNSTAGQQSGKTNLQSDMQQRGLHVPDRSMFTSSAIPVHGTRNEDAEQSRRSQEEHASASMEPLASRVGRSAFTSASLINVGKTSAPAPAERTNFAAHRNLTEPSEEVEAFLASVVSGKPLPCSALPASTISFPAQAEEQPSPVKRQRPRGRQLMAEREGEATGSRPLLRSSGVASDDAIAEQSRMKRARVDEAASGPSGLAGGPGHLKSFRALDEGGWLGDPFAPALQFLAAAASARAQTPQQDIQEDQHMLIDQSGPDGLLLPPRITALQPSPSVIHATVLGISDRHGRSNDDGAMQNFSVAQPTGALAKPLDSVRRKGKRGKRGRTGGLTTQEAEKPHSWEKFLELS